MTSSAHDPRLDHHPHHHPHDHPHPHDHTESSGLRLSRRHFLAASAGTLAGVLLLKVGDLIGKPLLPALAAQKRIYIAPDDHTDYFWTEDDVAYSSAFLA